MTQKPFHHCASCGADVPVTPLAGGFEFNWRCVCGMAGTISYAHYKPPPMFQHGPHQQELFRHVV